MRFTDRARALRKIQTSAESIFWETVRNGKTGLKFVRQKPIIYSRKGKKREFIADFYCKEKKVIIEPDGKIHESQQDYDNL